jgi:hypothetical protein
MFLLREHAPQASRQASKQAGNPYKPTRGACLAFGKKRARNKIDVKYPPVRQDKMEKSDNEDKYREECAESAQQAYPVGSCT